MKNGDVFYGISISYTVDSWHRADVNIPMGVRVVEDEPNSLFFKVYDKNGNCIFGVEKSRVLFWVKGLELDENKHVGCSVEYN